jgi:glutathione S-transferase
MRLGGRLSRRAAPYRLCAMRLFDYDASANCYKVRLLLAQLDLDYERVPVDIFGGDTLADAYLAVNPARETPVLEVPGKGFLPESGAILAYLAEDTPLLPADRWDRAQVMRWLQFEQTQVMGTMGGLRFRLITGRIEPGSPQAESRARAGRDALAILDTHLREREFLAGDRYSIADIAVYGYAHVAGEAGIDAGDFPAVTAWLGRVERTPGYMHDLAPYPANARVGQSRSIYG